MSWTGTELWRGILLVTTKGESKLRYVQKCGVVDRDRIVEGNSACNYIGGE